MHEIISRESETKKSLFIKFFHFFVVVVVFVAVFVFDNHWLTVTVSIRTLIYYTFTFKQVMPV